METRFIEQHTGITGGKMWYMGTLFDQLTSIAQSDYLARIWRET